MELNFRKLRADEIEVRVGGMNKTKACTKCKVEYPATSEYWHRKTSARDGLAFRCKECAKKRNRQWKQNNKEHLKGYDRRYRQENKEQLKEKRKLYYQENKEQRRKYDRRYRQENKEHLNEYQRQWGNNNKELIKGYRKQHYQENKEYIQERHKQYRQNNPDKMRKYKQRRRARKHKLPHTLTVQEWLETKQIFNNSCAYCGMTGEEHRQEYNEQLHQDHFIPLSKGGGYTKENIIPACRSCNASKNNTDFEEWYPQYEYYSKEREQKILDYIGGLKWLEELEGE